MMLRSLGPVLIALLLLSVSLAAGAGNDRDPGALAASIERVRLVLDDETVVEAREPISVRDSIVTFRLADGSLASLPIERVVSIDLESLVWRVPPATEEPGPPEPPASPGSPGSPEKNTAPSGKRSFSNADLPALPEGETPSAPQAAGGPEEDLPLPSYATYQDRKGRDEAWWRERVAGLEAETAAAEREVEEAYHSLGLVNRGYRGASAGGGRTSGRIQEARERLDRAQARWDALQVEWNELEREARQSGALPGWFR